MKSEMRKLVTVSADASKKAAARQLLIFQYALGKKAAAELLKLTVSQCKVPLHEEKESIKRIKDLLRQLAGE